MPMATSTATELTHTRVRETWNSRIDACSEIMRTRKPCVTVSLERWSEQRVERSYLALVWYRLCDSALPDHREARVQLVELSLRQVAPATGLGVCVRQ